MKFKIVYLLSYLFDRYSISRSRRLCVISVRNLRKRKRIRGRRQSIGQSTIWRVTIASKGQVDV